MSCPLHQLDDLLSSLLLPTEAGELTPSESYLIRRLRMNFRLDFSDLRSAKYCRISRTRFAIRGPNLTGLRQLLLRLSTRLRFLISGVPTTTAKLWDWLSQLAVWPMGHFGHLCNRVNMVPAPPDVNSVRYLPLVYFERRIGRKAATPSIEAEFKTWLAFDPTNLAEFLGNLGSKKSPRFYTAESVAPHLKLPAGVPLGSQSAAEHVVQTLGLPGHEDSARRLNRQGIVAIILPTRFLESVSRPTVMEALEKAYFFLPGAIGLPYGQTWPLTPCMSRNDLKKVNGCAEWAAGVDQTKVDLSQIRIEFVGPLS